MIHGGEIPMRFNAKTALFDKSNLTDIFESCYSTLILQYEASIAFDWSLKRPANAYAGHPHPS